jgi:hypothetical protein
MLPPLNYNSQLSCHIVTADSKPAYPAQQTARTCLLPPACKNKQISAAMSSSPFFPFAKPGHRFALPALHGSADAQVLADCATQLKADKRMLTVLVANPGDAAFARRNPVFQRRNCAAICCRTGKPCPTMRFLRIRIWCLNVWRRCTKSAADNAMYCSHR